MADTGIFATTAEVQAKVGANASSTYNAETYINQYVNDAEAYINCYVNYNFSDTYSGLNNDTKKILRKCAAAMAAMSVINTDMTNFQTIVEVQTRLNVLAYEVDQCLSLLKDKDVKTFISSS